MASGTKALTPSLSARQFSPSGPRVKRAGWWLPVASGSAAVSGSLTTR